MCGNIPGDQAGVSRGHSSSPSVNEGPNPEQGKGNPSGGAIGRRVAGIPDPNEYLLERILSRPNMSLAWRRVKANGGAPGVDNMPIDDFMAFAHEHWEKIRSSIFAGTYKPSESTLTYRLRGWRSQKQQEERVPLGFPPCSTA